MTALLMMEGYIGTMGGLVYFVLACYWYVGHVGALLFFLDFECGSL